MVFHVWPRVLRACECVCARVRACACARPGARARACVGVSVMVEPARSDQARDTARHAPVTPDDEVLEAVPLCLQLDDLLVDELLQQWPDNVGALSGSSSTLVEAKVVDLVLGCPSSTLRGFTPPGGGRRAS